MFNFDFNFLNGSLSTYGIIIDILSIFGAALATFIAATYAGNNANKIAKKNNENIWKLENKNREIDTINALYLAYNNFNLYIDSFFDSKADNERIKILDLRYDYENDNFAYHKQEQFIREYDISRQDSMKLGELITEQTNEYTSLLINLQNQLLLSRNYFDEKTYKELEKLINNYKLNFDFILKQGVDLKYNLSPSHQSTSKQLVHLNNRYSRIKSLYSEKGKFELDQYNDQNFDTPIILKYRYIFETHLQIKEILDNRINKI